MYRVLVPVDGDESRAFEQAKYVARLREATGEVAATVLYVVPPDEFETATDVAFSDVEGATDAADYLESEGVSVSRLVDDGSAGAEIVRTANERDVDEIVMCGRDRSGVASVLLGSTVQDVLVAAERPVTVTGERVVFGEGLRHVLLPVDTNVERARHQAEYVARLRDAGADLDATVLHVFPHLDYSGAPSHEFPEVDAAVAAADRLEERGVDVERVAVGGEVARRILAAADERDVDSVVVGGRKRSGVAAALLGSTVRDLLLSATRPVTVTG
jgi:nucleotide-binding universal stress UspA family protein